MTEIEIGRRWNGPRPVRHAVIDTAPKADWRHHRPSKKDLQKRRTLKEGARILGIFDEPRAIGGSRTQHHQGNQHHRLVQTEVDHKNTVSKPERHQMESKMFTRIAEATNTDRRSVIAQWEGRHITGKAGERIRAALQALSVVGATAPKATRESASK